MRSKILSQTTILVDDKILSKLCSFDESKNDGFFLSNQRGADRIQREHFRSLQVEIIVVSGTLVVVVVAAASIDVQRSGSVGSVCGGSK